MTTSRFVLVVSLLLALLGFSGSAGAQPPERTVRIGLLAPASGSDDIEGFLTGMRDLGYVESRNLIVEYRVAGGKVERLDDLLAELIRLKVDVIVTGGTPAALAAKRARTVIPVVIGAMGDPVEAGVVASLARPSGNVTGLVFEAAPEIFGKYVELLAETVPRLSRIAGLVDPRDPRNTSTTHWGAADLAAKRRGIVLQQVDVGGDDDVPRAFKRITDQRAGAVIVFSGPFLYSLRKQIADHALKNGLPAISAYRAGPEAGGLMSYGPSLSDLWRRAAIYVDKILKGAKPGDLPVEQPTKFELVINMKTAKALGLTIPQSILLRADQVID